MATTELYIGDPSLQNPILISSIPSGSGWSFTSGTLSASSQLNIVWTTRPSRPQLSLWNFLWTVRFGVDDSAHDWPVGSSLTTNQSVVEVSDYTDFVLSNDNINLRVNKIVMKNSSADSFSYYLYFKSYTFSSSVGATS